MHWLDFALFLPNPRLTLSCAMSRTEQRLAVLVRRIDGGGLVIHHYLLCESSGVMLSQELPLADTEGGSSTLINSFHFQVIMFSDLESDYVNPIDLANKLNQVRTVVLHATLPSPLRTSLSFPRTRHMLSLAFSSSFLANGLLLL